MTSDGLEYIVFSVHESYTLSSLANAIEAFGLELREVDVGVERQSNSMIKVTITKKRTESYV